jgi:YVTN family beta-propeller protein
VSPDGRWAFVTNYGAYGLFKDGVKPQVEPGSSITVIDLAGREVARTLALDGFTMPHGIQVSRDGATLWVTCEAQQAVLEVDVASGTIARSWQTGQDVSHMVVATPDERKLYVANIRSGSVTVIERASGKITTLATGAGAEGLDVAPDGSEVWVTNRSANTVSVIDVAGDTVAATLESGGEFPIRAHVTPDGREVLVSNAKSNQVAVFDRKTRARVAAIAVGAMPIGIEMTPDGARAFVANTNDDRVTVIDVAKRAVAGTFTTGKEPDGMAWATLRD